MIIKIIVIIISNEGMHPKADLIVSVPVLSPTLECTFCLGVCISQLRRLR